MSNIYVLISLLTIALHVNSMTISIFESVDQSIDPKLLKEAIIKAFPSNIKLEFNILIRDEVTNLEKEVVETDVIINTQAGITQSIELERLAYQYQTPYFSVNPVDRLRTNFQLELDWEENCESLSAYIQNEGWENFALFTGIEQNELAISKKIEQEFQPPIFKIDKGVSKQALSLLVGRMIKANGIKIFVINARESIANQIKESFINNKVYRINSAMLTISTHLPQQLQEGEIFILPQYSELAPSYEVSLANSFKQFFGDYSQNAQLLSSHQKYLILDKLREYSPDNKPIKIYDIVNIQNGQPIKVGSIDQNLKIQISAFIIYPGPTFNKPNNSRVIIPISSPLKEPAFGETGDFVNFYKRGEVMMIPYYNQNNTILQHFELQLNEIDCGLMIGVSPYVEECVKANQDRFGVYFSCANLSDPCSKQLNTLQELGMKIPSVSSTLYYFEYAIKEDFPYMSIIPPVNRHYWLALSRMLKNFNIKDVCYIADGIIIYDSEQALAVYKSQGINILNEDGPNEMGFEYLTDKQAINGLVSHIINLQCRYIISRIGTYYVSDLINEFIRQGIKPMDIIFAIQTASWDYTIEEEDEFTALRRELLLGTFAIQPDDLIGPLGQYLIEQASKYDAPVDTSSCHAVDAQALIAETLNWVILRGYDYEDGVVVNEASRTIQFLGCTGRFKLSEGANNRQLDTWKLVALQKDGDQYDFIK